MNRQTNQPKPTKQNQPKPTNQPHPAHQPIKNSQPTNQHQQSPLVNICCNFIDFVKKYRITAVLRICVISQIES